MIASLKYGSKEFSFTLPEQCQKIRHTEPVGEVDLDKFKGDLYSYLNNFKRSISNVGIAVSDKTRLCQFPLFLPLITEVFLAYGLKKQDITFYIAYGTHPRQSEEECLNSYGEIYKEYRFVHHDARDEDSLATFKTTTRGTRVKINREILQQDLIVTYGAILHHYIAGFGGGRKLLFPGLAGYDAILHNHSLFLDFENKRLDPGCESGRLDGNPMALDLEEINEMIPPRLEIHGILNSKKEVCEIHMGLNYDHFRKACARYDHFFHTASHNPYDLVLASAGGYPKDINFIQAHKSIHNAASFVKDGGTLVILAQCMDGIGNKAFLELFSLGATDGSMVDKSESIFREMEKQYKNNAGTALAIIQKSKRISIRLVSSLEKKSCRLMGTIKTTEKEAAGLIASETGDMAWIENASLLYC